MIIVMLGKPGSGKGTQAELLSRRLKIPIISVGNILRKIEKTNTKLARKIRSTIDKGRLVPDYIALGLVKKAVIGKRNVIFDGFPRTLYEAKHLEKIARPDIIFLINVSNTTIYKRLSKRYECVCGENYNLSTNPPKKDLLCDKCGRKIYRRPDDDPKVIMTRFSVFNKQTMPAINFYMKNERLVTINGDIPAKKAQEQVIKALKRKLLSR